MERRTVVLTALLLGVACLLTTSTADAGVVYTDETAFNAAVAGMGLTTIWTEDFESFAIGGVTDPLSIGGGAAEIGYGGGGAILDVPTSANAWVQDFGAPGSVTIQGPGENLVARSLVGGKTFARDGRFVNRRSALFDGPVRRDAFTSANDNQIAFQQRRGVHLDLFAILE
jgi:hypothetical protein